MTSGARQSRPVSSTIRMTLRGAACAAQRFQTPSVSSAVTEPARSAVVRLSDLAGGFPARTVARPPCTRAIAAVNPACPRPTTTTEGPLSFGSGIEQSPCYTTRFRGRRSETDSDRSDAARRWIRTHQDPMKEQSVLLLFACELRSPTFAFGQPPHLFALFA